MSGTHLRAVRAGYVVAAFVGTLLLSQVVAGLIVVRVLGSTIQHFLG